VQAIETLRPALSSFYASLGDEQKAKFNSLGQSVGSRKIAPPARFNALFPVAMQRSSSEGGMCFAVISWASKMPGRTRFPVASHLLGFRTGDRPARLVAQDEATAHP